jgi:hypothetical protein
VLDCQIKYIFKIIVLEIACLTKMFLKVKC